MRRWWVFTSSVIVGGALLAGACRGQGAKPLGGKGALDGGFMRADAAVRDVGTDDDGAREPTDAAAVPGRPEQGRAPDIDAAAPGGSDAAAPDGSDAAVPHAGGLSGSVIYNLVPKLDCTFDVPNAGAAFLYYPVGYYDLERRADEVSDMCELPYVVHLLLEASFDPGSDAGMTPGETVLQLHSASVELMTTQGEPIAFGAGAQPLPNPFLVTTNSAIALHADGQPARAIAAIEAIPVAYASQLDDHVGGQILAEIRMFGTTTDEVDLEFAPFAYPVELCAGCLVVCSSYLRDELLTPEDLLAGACEDQAGADGRFCIEPDC
jgi:hypothetical protein